MIKKQSIKLNQSVAQVKGNIVSDMGGEKVMLSITKGKYYNLGEIGGDIWNHIEVPITINQLVTTLTVKYDVEQTECLEQVISFLELLLEENLIEFVEEV